MKNKYFSILVVAIVATVASFNIYSSQKETPMSDLALANVEALANDESEGSNCPDSCKEWTGNSGGGIACDCGRYTGKCKNRC